MHHGERSSALCVYPNPLLRVALLTYCSSLGSSTLHLSRWVYFLPCWLSLGSRDFTSLRQLWIVVCYEISRFRLGRGVVVKLVISLTLKGEINNITLNNTLCCHYTTVYRLATVDSEIRVTSSAKQQSCQSVSV